TTFNPPNPDTWQGALNETIEFNISATTITGLYNTLAAGKSIEGASSYHNLVYFSVENNALIYEGDNASYCFDNEDNDLNDWYDCHDTSCNLTVNPANSSQRCEIPNEITCNDGYDNDRDGFTDCEDNDCFQKNGTTGPCYAIENYAPLSCADRINNDADWGYRCNASVSISRQTRQTQPGWSGTIQLTDCLDNDCNGRVGNLTTGAFCEVCTELTCNDGFDNDADGRYDCTGNAYRTLYERDCDRWHDILITCPTTETICYDNLDNDLDSDSPNGLYTWQGVPVYGGWDCQDMDCNGRVGQQSTGAVCQYRNETECDDGFDNDADGLLDCLDPVYCTNLSGSQYGLPGLCRPCAKVENISTESCRDGDDNDYDGLIDCTDSDCYGYPGPGTQICGLTENNCTDGVDNDRDSLIDINDSDCQTPPTTDELGPGQCDDNIDNDQDGTTDCGDSECENTIICRENTYNKILTDVPYSGILDLFSNKYIAAGENLTVNYSTTDSGITLNVGSIVLKLGNEEYPLSNITPAINSSTTWIDGETAGFTTQYADYGLKVQKVDGFNGKLNLRVKSQTNSSLTPGEYEIFMSSSLEGSYDTTTTVTYVSENELPTVNDIYVALGSQKTGADSVNVTITANVTDQGTFNSGIAWCNITIRGVNGTVHNTSVRVWTCEHTESLNSGSYNVSVVTYDGAVNKGNIFSKAFTFNATTLPYQTGDFYNPYPANNYPNKSFFNDTEKLNIGVDFNGGTGFVQNDTGCEVTIRNRTHNVSVQYVNLTIPNIAEPDYAACTGQINLSEIPNPANTTGFGEGVYYFTVSVRDSSNNLGLSGEQNINYCYYLWDNRSNKYRCMDACTKRNILNTPPVFITDIPNQTWPRGTSLTTIDLDDYFYDPDGDLLFFTWTIDSSKINVSIDASHLVTFTPDTAFYGFAHVTFYANDLFDSTPSNLITLEIVFRPFPQQPPIPAGGGGGGGGGALNRTEIVICEEDWRCTDWGICFPSGFQFRQCRDMNECGTTNDMPNTTRECLYVPTCRDKIRNQGEEQVDCGGPCLPCPSCTDRVLNQQEENTAQQMSANPKDISDCGGPFCPACPTCSDNTWNQNEEGIDCGGPCRPCATCEDGVRNQGEVNIDCGGPCPACRISITEQAFNWNVVLLIASFPFLAILIVLGLLFGIFKKKFIRLKARLLNYHLRLVRMFEKKKAVEHELHITQWLNAHLDSIQDSVSSKTTEELINSVDRLVRIFFKRVFLIRYAFTNDELVKELEKHRIPAVLRKATEILFEELSQIKYGGEEVNKDDLGTLINQVKVITERLVNEIETKKKTKISMSERDIMKISETLQGAHELGVKEAFKKMKR
ncbi:hypothetical protein KY363_03285, partial [Candidatus Woesearchaeota archaeon]|nr:hypothetical protein [Candidatus Woesearchaeota archaeon]